MIRSSMQPILPLADPESYRQAMRHWVAGVTIVTSLYQGYRHGMTVSSFTSISLIPPMILISLDRAARTARLISASRIFAVTILDASQQEISERFAGKISEEQDRFMGLETETIITGAPLIKGGLAYLDCRVAFTRRAGTSTVYFAEVLAAKSVPEGAPLVYSNRSYFKLQK